MSTLTTPIHLRMTEWFIDQNPITVAVKRRPRVANGTGGWTLGAETTPVAALWARMVPVSLVEGLTSIVSEDGEVVRVSGTLVCMPDVDIRVGDYFTLSGKLWTVRTLSDSPPWRKNCGCSRAS